MSNSEEIKLNITIHQITLIYLNNVKRQERLQQQKLFKYPKIQQLCNGSLRVQPSVRRRHKRVTRR